MLTDYTKTWKKKGRNCVNNEIIIDENLISNMEAGDEKSIYHGLMRTGTAYRINAIIQTVKHKISNDDIISKIKELKNDNCRVIGIYKMSDFAISALVLLGIEKYHGNDEIILKLIDSNFDFYDKHN